MNRGRREIIYSLIIIVLIPLLFVFNTLLLARRIRSDTNLTVRRHADQINTVMAESLRKGIETKDYAGVKKQITEISKQQASIGSLFVAKKVGDNYLVIANTSDAPTELSENDKLQLSIVFQRARSTAKRIDLHTNDGRTLKGWNVVTPLLDTNSNTEAVISTNVLTSDAEELVDNTLLASFIATAVSVIVIVLLLLNHFKFVGYVNLLNRQKEVNQTMSDFLSVATHELRAPMTIIKGYISNVTDGTFGEVNDKIKDSLNTAAAQTDRLNNLVQDLLNVSRIDQGKISMDIQKANIQDTIKMIVAGYEKQAREKRVEMFYHPKNAADVLVDVGRFQEIMTNLIDNAFKYTETGMITVAHRREGKMLITTIIDTGAGMNEEEQSRLFQRFYRVQNASTKGIPGTGLGLWITKKYIEMMGGKITVSSIVGVGTEFSIAFKTAD